MNVAQHAEIPARIVVATDKQNHNLDKIGVNRNQGSKAIIMMMMDPFRHVNNWRSVGGQGARNVHHPLAPSLPRMAMESGSCNNNNTSSSSSKRQMNLQSSQVKKPQPAILKRALQSLRMKQNNPTASFNYHQQKRSDLQDTILDHDSEDDQVDYESFAHDREDDIASWFEPSDGTESETTMTANSPMSSYYFQEGDAHTSNSSIPSVLHSSYSTTTSGNASTCPDSDSNEDDGRWEHDGRKDGRHRCVRFESAAPQTIPSELAILTAQECESVWWTKADVRIFRAKARRLAIKTFALDVPTLARTNPMRSEWLHRVPNQNLLFYLEQVYAACSDRIDESSSSSLHEDSEDGEMDDEDANNPYHPKHDTFDSAFFLSAAGTRGLEMLVYPNMIHDRQQALKTVLRTQAKLRAFVQQNASHDSSTTTHNSKSNQEGALLLTNNTSHRVTMFPLLNNLEGSVVASPSMSVDQMELILAATSTLLSRQSCRVAQVLAVGDAAVARKIHEEPCMKPQQQQPYLQQQHVARSRRLRRLTNPSVPVQDWDGETVSIRYRRSKSLCASSSLSSSPCFPLCADAPNLIPMHFMSSRVAIEI